MIKVRDLPIAEFAFVGIDVIIGSVYDRVYFGIYGHIPDELLHQEVKNIRSGEGALILLV